MKIKTEDAIPRNRQKTLKAWLGMGYETKKYSEQLVEALYEESYEDDQDVLQNFWDNRLFLGEEELPSLIECYTEELETSLEHQARVFEGYIHDYDHPHNGSTVVVIDFGSDCYVWRVSEKE